jgi:hypothetical protein
MATTANSAFDVLTEAAPIAEYVLPVGDEFAAAERNGTANYGAACL